MAHATPDRAARTNRRAGARFILAVSVFAAVLFFFIATTSRCTRIQDLAARVRAISAGLGG